jgi:hypothetical protein
MVRITPLDHRVANWRAERFPIRTELDYRTSSDGSWRRGLTLNISRSGVLFEAENEVEPKTMIEMRIVFPPEITGSVPANVVCWGPIVRAQGVALAAAILRYRFSRE